MKKLLFTLIIIHFSLVIAQAQSGWVWQNPLPFGNQISDIYFFDSQTGLLSLTNGTILKTINSGSNWNTFAEPGYSLYDFHFFDNANGIAFSGSNIFRTTNSGSNWNNYSVYPFVIRKFFYTASPQVFYANAEGTYANIVKSTNSGVNWNSIYQDSTEFLWGMHFPSADTGYISTHKVIDTSFVWRVKKTTNGGISWFIVDEKYSQLSSGIFFLNNNTGYAMDADSLFKTTNGGSNWLHAGPPPQVAYNHSLYFVNENTGYFDINYVTTNGGLSWQSISIHFDNSEIYKLSFAGTIIFGIGSGVICRSANNGLNWTELTSGFHTNFEDVHFINEMTGLVCGEYGKLLKTTNGGVNWNLSVTAPLFSNEFSSISMPDPNSWYVSEFMTGRILRTTNAGVLWDTTYSNVYGPTRLKFINVNTGFGVCKYNYFIKTTNAGTNWNVTNLQISQNWALDFIDENKGMIGGNHTLITSNGGNNWNDITNQFGIISTDIQYINQNLIYVSGYNGNNGKLFKSTNAGTSWQSCTFPEQISYLWDIYFLNANYGFASSASGLYRTTNGGSSFVKLNSPYAIVYTFTDSLTGYGVGNYGTIIKTTTGGAPIGIQSISNELPTRFALHQNYPNPFNPTTKIKFDVPLSKGGYRGLSIQLFIYDITGREIATLLNEQLQAGTYEVEWDGTKYASGVYFYQLIAGDYNLTKKMVLLK